MTTLQKIEQELKNTAEQLEEENLAASERINKELAEHEAAKQREIIDRNTQYAAHQARHEKRKAQEEHEESRRIKAETEARIKMEQEIARAEWQVLLKKQKVEELRKVLIEAQISEEKHSKALEEQIRPYVTRQARSKVVTPHETTGNAAIGTGGGANSHLMSEHLKHILRQN